MYCIGENREMNAHSVVRRAGCGSGDGVARLGMLQADEDRTNGRKRSVRSGVSLGGGGGVAGGGVFFFRWGVLGILCWGELFFVFLCLCVVGARGWVLENT